MKAEAVYNQFVKTAKYFLKELDYYGKNQFRKKSEGKIFTVGELYDFLINSTTQYYIPKIDECLKKQASKPEGKKSGKGKLVFWYGRYPGIFKHQEISGYVPVQPESPEKVKDMIFKFLKLMSKKAQEIDRAEAQGKIEHPNFGMLSALEWYRLIDMNFRHYISLKLELDKELRSASPERGTGEEEYVDDRVYRDEDFQ